MRAAIPGRKTHSFDDPCREQVAVPVHPEQGEIDYPTIYVEPLKCTMDVLEQNDDCWEMLASIFPPASEMGAAQKRLLFVNGTMGAGALHCAARFLKQMQPAVFLGRRLVLNMQPFLVQRGDRPW